MKLTTEQRSRQRIYQELIEMRLRLNRLITDFETMMPEDRQTKRPVEIRHPKTGVMMPVNMK